MRRAKFAVIGLATLAVHVVGSALEFDIEREQLIEITPPPGSVITKNSLPRYKHLLDPELAKFIRDGALEIKIGELLSFPPHPAYQTATTRAPEDPQIAGPGQLAGYSGGRPFRGPPRLADPFAGEKIAWNMRLLYNGDSGRIPELHLQYRDLATGARARALVLAARSMRFMYRHVVPPVPAVRKNLQNALGAFQLRALDAGDLTGAEVLAFFNRDDSDKKKGWVYIPQLRRSQSLASFPPRETMFGSDILPDDFLGYSGRIVDMQWRYLGASYTLLPFYRHDQAVLTETKAQGLDYRFVHFHGQGSCFPNVPWQLRKVYILEGTTKISNSPVSKRYFYIDAQTYYPALARIYDDDGRFWKLAINGLAHANSHLPQNHESGAPIIDSASMIDVVNKRCTTVQLLVLVNVTDVEVADFNPANLGGDARGRR